MSDIRDSATESNAFSQHNGGYLNFRFRKFEFLLRIRHKNGNGNAPFHPVLKLMLLTPLT